MDEVPWVGAAVAAVVAEAAGVDEAPLVCAAVVDMVGSRKLVALELTRSYDHFQNLVAKYFPF